MTQIVRNVLSGSVDSLKNLSIDLSLFLTSAVDLIFQNSNYAE